MKFIATNKSKIDSIPFEKGQLIFSRDEKTIYLDSDVRTSFNTFIMLETEQERKDLISPVNGIYFVDETKLLYRLNGTTWTVLNEKPQQAVIFIDGNELPNIGQSNTIYVLDTKTYVWDEVDKKFNIMNEVSWEPIN